MRVWTGTPATYVDLVCDEAGDIVFVSAANRPRGDEGPTPWEGRFEDYRTLGGLRVPARGEVTWLLRDGRFAYWRGEITALALE